MEQVKSKSLALSYFEGVKFWRVKDDSGREVLRFWLAPKGGSYLHLGYRGEDLAVMQRHLACVALAVAAYRAERGKLPAAMTDLSPEFLADLPADVFTDRPLAFRRDGQSLVIYSLGPNRKDDGGRRDIRTDADDLAIGFRPTDS